MQLTVYILHAAVKIYLFFKLLRYIYSRVAWIHWSAEAIAQVISTPEIQENLKKRGQ